MKKTIKLLLSLLMMVSIIVPSILANPVDEDTCYECMVLKELSNNIYYYQYPVNEGENIDNDDIIEVLNGLIIYKKNLDNNGILDKDSLGLENIDWDYWNEKQVSGASYEIEDTIAGNSSYNGTYALPSGCNNAYLKEKTHNYTTCDDEEKIIMYMTRGTAHKLAYEMELRSHWADVFNYLGSYIPGVKTFLSIVDGLSLANSLLVESNSVKLENYLTNNLKVKVTIGESFSISYWDGKNIEIKNYNDTQKNISVSTAYHCFFYDAN